MMKSTSRKAMKSEHVLLATLEAPQPCTTTETSHGPAATTTIAKYTLLRRKDLAIFRRNPETTKNGLFPMDDTLNTYTPAGATARTPTVQRTSTRRKPNWVSPDPQIMKSLGNDDKLKKNLPKTPKNTTPYGMKSSTQKQLRKKECLY